MSTKNFKQDNGNKTMERDDISSGAKSFPSSLMELLSDERNQDAIVWLPHGKAFIIRSRKLFEEKVMPRYFSRKSKYSSFTRKLNRWNFTRISSGPDLGAYYHEFFLRDKPFLAAQMFCKNAHTKLTPPAATETEPTQQEEEETSAAVPPAAIPTATVPPTVASMSPHMLSLMNPLALQKKLVFEEQLLKLQMLEQMKKQAADNSARMLMLETLAARGITSAPTPMIPTHARLLQAQLEMQQQSQARMLQMQQILAMRQQRGVTPRRTPNNKRASAA